MEKVLKFSDCIKKSGMGRRHVLLGNGFSRACRDGIFSYDSLFEAAEWNADNALKDVFDAIETRDFEAVMEALEISAALGKAYSVPPDISKKMKTDATKLRSILVGTLAKHHPESPESIKENEYVACKEFLQNFERIYTVNYDLLLYWTLMKGKRKHDDGFRDPFEGESKDYYQEDFVKWKNHENSQTIYYLHGALHLFLDGPELKKFCWSRTGVKLKTQILEALEKRVYPLIVAAGKSSQKLGKIQRSNYLGHGYRSIRKIGGSLFVYGHSMSDKDEHILNQIRGNTTLGAVYVGVFGDQNLKANQVLIQNAKGLVSGRKKKDKELTVEFFDASTAKVWGK